MMSNFSLYYSIYGSGEDRVITINDIQENDIVRECIKYTYGLYINIIDFVL
jgi:ribonuclease ZC3H12